MTTGSTDSKKNRLCSAWERRDLPIDSSLNQLKKHSGMSRTVICTAMERLEPGKEFDQDSLYYKVRTGRLSEQEKEKRDYNTKASALFWEIEELVRALTAARLHNPRAEGDALARETFRELANGLTGKNPDSLRYPDYYSLRYESIRASMFEDFWPEISARMFLITDLLTRQLPPELEANLRTALPVLDDLIIQLAVQRSDEEFKPQQADVSIIKALYEDLMKLRKEITTSAYGDRKINFDRAQPEKEIKELVDVMKQYKKTLGPAELDAFEANYDKFLCVNDPVIQGYIPDAREFMQRYSELHTYIKGEPKEYEVQVREELQKYVQRLFEDLLHFDDVPYSYDEYHSHSAQTAFLSNRLRNAHEQIRAAIHAPLYHLRMYNTLFHFGAVITKNGEKLTASLLQDLNKLAQDFPQLPLYHSGQAFDKKAFTEAYATTASPYLFGKTVPSDLVEQFLLRNDLRGWASLLHAECELVAAWKSEIAVQECIQQVKFLNKHLTRCMEQMKQQEESQRRKRKKKAAT